MPTYTHHLHASCTYYGDLTANERQLRRNLHPPVTGGKNATSSPAWSGASPLHMAWLSAMRTALPWASACAAAALRAISSVRRAPTVAAVVASSSLPVPIASRIEAKYRTVICIDMLPNRSHQRGKRNKAHAVAGLDVRQRRVVDQAIAPDGGGQHR